MMSLLNDVTMQLLVWGHKHCLWFLLSFVKDISSDFIDIKIIKRVVVYSSFLLIFSFSFFSSFFQFPDSPLQKVYPEWFSPSSFNQYFYLHQQFMFFVFICPCVYLSVFGGFFCVCVLITPKLMNTSLYFLWVGSLQRKKLLILG